MFGDIGKMMKEAQALQARMAEAQEEIARIEATGTSGGGLVAVTVSGKGEVKGIESDKHRWASAVVAGLLDQGAQPSCVRSMGQVSASLPMHIHPVLGAQLAEPWTILRIVSAVMEHPTESYLSGSELAAFATRLMDSVDANLKLVAAFDLNGGAPTGEVAAATVEILTLQVTELENAIDLAREGGWGARIQKQKQSLAGVVEKRLRELPRLQAAALPSQRVRVARALVAEPELTSPPDQGHVERCRSLLSFAEGIRASANYGGFAHRWM